MDISLQGSFVLKGNIIWSGSTKRLQLFSHSFVVCEDGVCRGVFEQLPERFAGLPLRDCGEQLILPALCDLHLHAPQYQNAGLGLDYELLDWITRYTFPEEAKYAEEAYARAAYARFTQDLKTSPVTRAVLFGTVHRGATELLMELMEQSGLVSYVGKVNMDRNCSDALHEPSPQALYEETRRFLLETKDRFRNTKPILTPRFVPAVSDESFAMLARLEEEFRVPVQSHLSENLSEVAWVKELCPDCRDYASAYAKWGLFGERANTVMAHCVHCTEAETELMRKNGVFVAHCPLSNTHLSSGVAPVRRYLGAGIRVGLGSDISGGQSLNIFDSMVEAIGASKLRWRLGDQSEAHITVAEAFYMATRGGGAFFGKVGAFEEGYEFDAVAVEDEAIRTLRELPLYERLERAVFLSQRCRIAAKFVRGRRVL